MTLYELTSQFQWLLLLAEDPEVDPQTLADTMEGLTGEIEVKAEGYAVVIGEIETEIAKFQKEKARIEKTISGLMNNAKSMKESLMNTMDVMGKKKIQTEHYKISIRGNGGIRPMKITGDVPAEYCKLEPDNGLIRKALDEGKELEFAHFEERGVHLSIR